MSKKKPASKRTKTSTTIVPAATGTRAEYGKQILATLSQELTKEYGKGFTVSALSRMTRLVEVFPDQQVVQTLSARLGWSHFVEILPLDDPLKRDFYADRRSISSCLNWRPAASASLNI